MSTSRDFQFNIEDLVTLLAPKDKKTKYTNTLSNLISDYYRNDSLQDSNVYESKDYLISEFGLNKNDLNKLSPFQIIMIYSFLRNLDKQDIRNFKKFVELVERNLIENKDVTSYTSFTQINDAVSAAEIKLLEKSLKKQIRKIYEDDEWLMLRPLTYLSSCKYGASTKWCTTHSSSNEYFIKYANNGALVYIINKKNNTKVACYKQVHGDSHLEFSFWNVKDNRIDSIESGLPDFILKKIKTEVSLKLTNFDFLSQDVKLNELRNKYNGVGESVPHN